MAFPNKREGLQPQPSRKFGVEYFCTVFYNYIKVLRSTSQSFFKISTGFDRPIPFLKTCGKDVSQIQVFGYVSFMISLIPKRGRSEYRLILLPKNYTSPWQPLCFPALFPLLPRRGLVFIGIIKRPSKTSHTVSGS